MSFKDGGGMIIMDNDARRGSRRKWAEQESRYESFVLDELASVQS